MKGVFNQSQFDQDWRYVSGFFVKFFKSFGPSQKKVKDKPVGFLHEQYIRFRLMLVEMGISRVIRNVILIVVGTILYFTIFRNVDPFLKSLTVLGFLLYYIWLFMPHLEDDKKAGSWFAEHSIDLHKFFWVKEEVKKKK